VRIALVYPRHEGVNGAERLTLDMYRAREISATRSTSTLPAWTRGPGKCWRVAWITYEANCSQGAADRADKQALQQSVAARATPDGAISGKAL